MIINKKLTTNKALEFVSCIRRAGHSKFYLDINYSQNTDHAGFHFYLFLICWQLELNIYDTRHWDYENNCWKVYKDVDIDEEL